MPVGVQGDAGRGVAELALDRLDAGALADHQRRGRVPQVVQPQLLGQQVGAAIVVELGDGPVREARSRSRLDRCNGRRAGRASMTGMSFFERRETEASATPRRLPPWLRPPANVVPVDVPLGLLVARTEVAVIAIPAVQVYPIGLSLSLMVRMRDQQGARVGMHHSQYAFDPSSDDFVRLGVQFADGGKATNLRRPRPPSDQPPAGPLLTPHGGSGSIGAWDTHYWLWPLPPPGLLRIVAEWPAQHISETAVEVTADPIREAAAHAVTLWPEEDAPAGPVGYVRIDGGT